MPSTGNADATSLDRGPARRSTPALTLSQWKLEIGNRKPIFILALFILALPVHTVQSTVAGALVHSGGIRCYWAPVCADAATSGRRKMAIAFPRRIEEQMAIRDSTAIARQELTRDINPEPPNCCVARSRVYRR